MDTPPRQPLGTAIRDTTDAILSSASGSMPSPGTGTVATAPILLGKVSRARSLLSWAIGLLGFLALIFVVLHFGSLERMIELARSARPAWLLLAVLAQAVTYVAAALVWRQALRRAGHPRSLRTLVPLGIAKLFTDQVVPSGGVSGAILVARGLA